MLLEMLLKSPKLISHPVTNTLTLTYQMQKIGYLSSFNGYYNGIQSLYSNWRHIQRLPLLLLFSTSSSSSSTNKGNNNNNKTYSSFARFLVKSLGFSTHQSLIFSSELSKQRDLNENSKEKDTLLIKKVTCVVHFLKQQGFQEPDIRKLFLHVPRIVVSKVDKTLKPKVNLLLDLGFSGSDLILTITRVPKLLTHGLGPAIHSLKTVFGSDEDVITVLKRSNGFYLSQVTKNMIPNVELLQSFGIPIDKIRKHIINNTQAFMVRPDLFRDRLIRVEEKLGIPRESKMFLYGLRLLISFSEKNIADKCLVFRSFGWTQSDVTALLMRHPMCFTLSEGRIRENLEYLMNQMDYKPDFLALHPSLIGYSVKKRLVPRYRFLQILKEKGLIQADCSYTAAAFISERHFLKKFVLPFQEVHQVYAELTGSSVG